MSDPSNPCVGQEMECALQKTVDEAKCAFKRGQSRERLLKSSVKICGFANGVPLEPERLAPLVDAFRQSLKESAAKDFKEALDLYENVLAVDPGIDGIYLTRAACYLHLVDYSGGAQAYEVALAEGRHLQGASAHVHVDGILAAVNSEMLLKEPREKVVISLLQSAMKLSSSPPRLVQVSHGLADAYLHFKDLSSAAKLAENVLTDGVLLSALYSDISDWHREKVSDSFKEAGNDLQNEAALEQAKYMYSLSMRVCRWNYEAHCHRAYVNLKLRLCTEAVYDASTAICGSQDNRVLDMARRSRSEAYLSLGQPFKACTDLSAITDKTQDDIIRLGITLATLALDECHAPLQPTVEQADGEGEVPAISEQDCMQLPPPQHFSHDNAGDVIPVQSGTILDDEAEVSCSLEDSMQRVRLAENAVILAPSS